MAASVFAVVHESEVGAAIVVFQGECSLVGSGIVNAFLEQGLNHADETVKVDREVVVHLQGHVVFVRDCALVEELYVSLGGDLETDRPGSSLIFAAGQHTEVQLLLSLHVLT